MLQEVIYTNSNQPNEPQSIIFSSIDEYVAWRENNPEYAIQEILDLDSKVYFDPELASLVDYSGEVLQFPVNVIAKSLLSGETITFNHIDEETAMNLMVDEWDLYLN